LAKLATVHNALSIRLDQAFSIADQKAEKIIFLLIAVYVAVFSVYTFIMHYAFYTYAWDLGIFTQSLWTTVNKGQFFHYTIEAYVNPSQNFLGVHFSPVLLLVVPVYALAQSPITLLVLQSFVIGITALPIYWLARDKLNNKVWGLVFAAAFLLHPGVHSINCFDFHVEAFIPLFFIMAFYYFDKQKWLRGIVFAVLTLSTLEFAPILILVLAAYLFLKTLVHKENLNWPTVLKKMTIPIVLGVISIVWFFMAFQVMYDINPLKAIGLPGRWDLWGRSMSEVVINVINNPIKALSVMFNPIDKVYYVLSALAPVLFLPFLALGEFALAVPWVIAALLSDYGPYYEYYYQYFGLFVAQIFIAAIYGTRNQLKLPKVSLNKRAISSFEKKFMLLIVLISLVTTLAISPLGAPALTTRRIKIDSHTQMLNEVLDMIPLDASVATQNNILPHLAQREKIYALGWQKQSTADSLDADIIIVDMKSAHFLYAPYTTFISPKDALLTIVSNESLKKQYGIRAFEDNILLLEKNYAGTAIIKHYEKTFDTEDLTINTANAYMTFDSSSSSSRVIVCDVNFTGRVMDRVVWYGPYVYLFGDTGGNGESKGWDYSATFRIKIKGNSTVLGIDAFSLDDQNAPVSKQLTASDFKSMDEWQEFTIFFTVSSLQRWEFRGWVYSNDAYIALDYVEVKQVSP
jgi:uncharacterized membrane protein